MWFAATVQHAQEIMASLDPANARMIGGQINTNKAERAKLVSDFKAQRFRHLVSVGTMTTGVDFTHVDCIAILRATESVSLLQQIIGRGLRMHEGKADCLVLDYGGNIDKHCPDADLFRPEIKAQYQSASEGTIEAECEECGYTNTFSPRPNEGDWPIDKHGYFVDLDGSRLTNNDGKEIPAHFGRRCCKTRAILFVVYKGN
jgi:DNA repair protein RadD